MEDQRNLIRKVVTGFGILCMACGILMIIGTVWVYLFAEESRSWPSTSATILSSKVQSYKPHSTVGASNMSVRFKPAIEYTYTVNNKIYSGNRVSFSPIGGGNRSPSQWYVSRYKVGESSPVYYDSKNPERSTLVKGSSALNYAAIFSGMVFILFGLARYKLRNVYAESIE